ncbi:hypothetical protein M1L60_33265 [Actinoplanes sp. TRM 88003]|uniref:Secreted protein n=1 Tax=Paractinoplanes aksuensis TaxID=2939490 RepID=A0ABT1DX91_9ACTN|nr:hypothetical protein [Actinoplanes aksuensis]MCO8275464.1 hypothetical protein [Actinoplanes aksuensis]
MKLSIKTRLSTALALAMAAAGALTLGTVSPAAAATPFELKVCSSTNYRTLASWQGGALDVPRGECKRHNWQPWGPNPSLVLNVALYGGSRYITTARVDIVPGAGLCTSGTTSSPSAYSC